MLKRAHRFITALSADYFSDFCLDSQCHIFRGIYYVVALRGLKSIVTSPANLRMSFSEKILIRDFIVAS